MPRFQALCLCVCRGSLLHWCQRCKFPPVVQNRWRGKPRRRLVATRKFDNHLGALRVQHRGGEGAPGNSLDAQRFQSLHK